ncbi:MAG TPA: hypothetical protein VNL36_08825 [Bacteroidota bacterium]|nr:hypothetical protein [Bacteroidota bacterium]
MKKLFSAIAICCVVMSSSTYGQSFFNPGVKFSHTFGEQGGYTFGVEMSYTFASRGLNGLVGLVFSQDICFSANRRKAHFGVEYIPVPPFVGLQVGPSFLKDDHGSSVGFTTTLFSGAFLLPYAALTFQKKKSALFEAGTYLKIHFPLERISLVH